MCAVYTYNQHAQWNTFAHNFRKYIVFRFQAVIHLGTIETHVLCCDSFSSVFLFVSAVRDYLRSVHALCYGCGWMCYFFSSILLNKYITAERQTILSVTECAVVILPWRENIHPTFSISALNTHDTFKLILFTGICISFAVIFILYWIFCSLHRVCYFFSILLPFFWSAPLYFFLFCHICVKAWARLCEQFDKIIPDASLIEYVIGSVSSDLVGIDIRRWSHKIDRKKNPLKKIVQKTITIWIPVAMLLFQKHIKKEPNKKTNHKLKIWIFRQN